MFILIYMLASSIVINIVLAAAWTFQAPICLGPHHSNRKGLHPKPEAREALNPEPY